MALMENHVMLIVVRNTFLAGVHHGRLEGYSTYRSDMARAIGSIVQEAKVYADKPATTDALRSPYRRTQEIFIPRTDNERLFRGIICRLAGKNQLL